MTDTEKRCTTCGTVLTGTQRTTCDPCKRDKRNAYHREWEAAHPREQRGQSLRTECKDCGKKLQGKEETYCGPCRAKRNQVFKEKARARRTICRDCGQPLDGSDLYRCRACQAAYMRAWRENGGTEKKEALRAQARANTIARKYGLTPEQFDSLWEQQGGKCDACQCLLVLSVPQGEVSTQRVEVDHDHTTGRVRGLLCGSCNSALGRVGDSIDRVFALLTYLAKQQENKSWLRSV